MFIGLKIDNVDSLPNGGPLSFQAHDRGFEIGRENRDWTLPDPDKFISGRHCEVRYENGGFWLYDVSRNGTFVNGTNQRLASPHRLGNGDKLRIGRYLVSVSIGDERAATPTESFGYPKPTPARTAEQFSFAGDPFLASVPPINERTSSQSPSYSSLPASASPPPVAPNLSAAGSDILRTIAVGAGIPPETLLQRDPAEIAAEIGSVLRSVVDELALLLKARAAAKVLAKSTHRTMVSATDNNPLKFVPGSDEILEIMFARRRAGYLDARRSIEDAFHDLKTHEFATYAAMQAALSRLLDDFSPDAIEKKLPPSSFTSKKTRAWDVFVATWEAKEAAHENGMLDVFLAYFSEAYAKAVKPK